MKIVGHIRGNKRGLLVSVAAVVALATTAAFTLGAFSATIVNPTNTFSSATIQLEEGNGGSTTCFSTGTGTGGSVTTNSNPNCAINVLTGTLDQIPGVGTLTSTITLTNAGNHAASVATLAVGACSVAAASDANGYVGADLTPASAFCSKVDVTISNTTTTPAPTDPCVYPTQATACPTLSNTYNLSTLAAQTFNTTPMSALAAGGTATYQVKVQLDASATNADQGLTATEPFTWSISQ